MSVRPASLADVGVIDALGRSRLMAIVRRVSQDLLLDTAIALAAGGVTALEVTADTRGGLDAISAWRKAIGPSVCIGVGTVLDEKVAAEAISAGADFLVAPNTDERVIDLALDAGVPMIPGALTPTEIVRAHRAGAAAVKVFPVSALGGARYLASLTGPLRDIPLLSVGGVRTEDVVAHLAAGAFAVGLGLNLVDRELVDAHRFDEIERRARLVITAVSRQR